MYVQTFQFPRIVSMFYAEFHPIQGPKVIYDVPEGTLTSHDSRLRLLDFDAFSEYIIPKTSVTGRIVTLFTTRHKMVGYPMQIEDPRYPRNALMFNLVFVFERDADTRAYEPVVRKMAQTLRTLEIESGYLSTESKKDRIRILIEQIYEDLNSMRECLIPLDEEHIINLKLLPVLNQPPPVFDHNVPLLLVPIERLELDEWDITARKIIQHIDGVTHIQGIARHADVDTDKVRRLVRHLIYYGHAITLDIFQFSNMYSMTPDAKMTIEDPELQIECINYITRPGFTPHTFSRILSLYSLLKHGITVREWAQKNQADLIGIDIRRMIVFGVANRILRRIHVYPYLPAHRRKRLPLLLQDYLDGTHSYDEICVAIGHSRQELYERLSKEPGYLELSR